MAKRYVEGESAPYTELQVVEDGAPPMLPKYKIFLLNATQFGLNFLVLLLSVVVVPAQVEKLVGGTHKGRTMGGMVAGGAAVTFLVSPLIGMVSDRITSRMGKRRPVMLVGTALLCGGLLGMAVSAPEINIHTGTPVNVSMMTPGLKVNHSKVAADEYHCMVNLEERRCSPFRGKGSNRSLSGEYGQAAPLKASDIAAHAHGVVMPRITRYQPEVIKPAGNLGQPNSLSFSLLESIPRIC